MLGEQVVDRVPTAVLTICYPGRPSRATNNAGDQLRPFDGMCMRRVGRVEILVAARRGALPPRALTASTGDICQAQIASGHVASDEGPTE